MASIRKRPWRSGVAKSDPLHRQHRLPDQEPSQVGMARGAWGCDVLHFRVARTCRHFLYVLVTTWYYGPAGCNTIALVSGS